MIKLLHQHASDSQRLACAAKQSVISGLEAGSAAVHTVTSAADKWGDFVDQFVSYSRMLTGQQREQVHFCVLSNASIPARFPVTGVPITLCFGECMDQVSICSLWSDRHQPSDLYRCNLSEQCLLYLHLKRGQMQVTAILCNPQPADALGAAHHRAPCEQLAMAPASAPEGGLDHRHEQGVICTARAHGFHLV